LYLKVIGLILHFSGVWGWSPQPNYLWIFIEK